jgi:hypothetical protein
MFHRNPKLEVYGPKGVQVEDMDGNILPWFEDEVEAGVHLRRNTDSVRIFYGDKSAVVGLSKKAWSAEPLNIFTYGIGFVLDDLTKTWYNYSPVLVTIDSSRTDGLRGIKATTSTALGEEPGSRRPELLLLGGPSLSFEANGPSPLGTEGDLFPVTAFQGGFGINFYRMFEVFYMSRMEFSYPLSSERYTGSSAITASDLCVRYFPVKSYFVQAAYGKASIGEDYYYGYYYDLFGRYRDTPTKTTIPEVGLGVGWAGDLSYISLQYFTGLSSFDLTDYSKIRYHTIYLNIGLNLRL